jgi:hypothetical protein
MRPNYANAKNRLLQSEPKQPHTFINWSKLNDADILMQYHETMVAFIPSYQSAVVIKIFQENVNVVVLNYR